MCIDGLKCIVYGFSVRDIYLSKLILEALGFQKKPLTVCHACLPASGFDGDIEPCRVHQ